MTKVEVTELTKEEYEELKQELEDSGDFEILEDVSLDALIEGLEYNGFTPEQIKQRNNQLYGSVFDFYKVKDKSHTYYALASGSR